MLIDKKTPVRILMSSLSKDEIFLDKRWQESHILKIKNRAGNRYTPKLLSNI